MMCFFDPDHLSDLCVFTVYCFYTLAFFGIFILRRRNKGKERPFSTPLYPLIPLISIAGGLFVGITVIGLPALWVVKEMDKHRQM